MPGRRFRVPCSDTGRESGTDAENPAMTENPDVPIQRINQKIMLSALLGSPGAICLGLGLFGLLDSSSSESWPLLANSTVAWSLLAAGFVIESISMMLLLPQVFKLARLKRSAQSGQ